jgi:hypothetical protein
VASSDDIPQFFDAASSHPLPIRALNRVGRLFVGDQPLTATAVWSTARKGALAECEPTPEAREALSVLLESVAKNVRMNTVGRFSVRDDTVRIARTHLRVHRALRDTREVRTTRLPPPVFIIGWPRTGSTFLHQLLGCDPSSRTIPYWESFDPVPPGPGRPDRRRADLARMLSLLDRIEPRYATIHPMTATSTEECVALFMNDFRTLQFGFQYFVPEYTRWLLEQDASIAYALYEQQLRLIQYHRPHGVRQVLKDPTHLVHLETVVDRFPDARFVFTHRDPAVTLSSICSLVAYTRALFTDEVDPVAIGAEVFGGIWPVALERAGPIRDALPPGRIAHVCHAELVRDPIRTTERVYGDLGIDFSEDARASMRAFVEHEASRRGGRHVHSPEGFGLERAAIRERFSAYCSEFDL